MNDKTLLQVTRELIDRKNRYEFYTGEPSFDVGVRAGIQIALDLIEAANQPPPEVFTFIDYGRHFGSPVQTGTGR